MGRMPPLGAMTTTLTDPAADQSIPTAEDILRLVEEIATMRRPIGELCGYLVFVDPKVQGIELHGPDGVIRFSVDHPYIQGTKLEQEARTALQNGDRDGS